MPVASKRALYVAPRTQIDPSASTSHTSRFMGGNWMSASAGGRAAVFAGAETCDVRGSIGACWLLSFFGAGAGVLTSGELATGRGFLISIASACARTCSFMDNEPSAARTIVE